MNQLKDDFKFIFFVSMPTMDEQIGFHLCEQLTKVSQKLGETNFVFHNRISKRYDDKPAQAFNQ